MNPFVRNMHAHSGLLEKIRASENDIEFVENDALAILSRHASCRTARLCGNSVWQDRRFLEEYMPSFERYLHYRQIDVSSLKELGDWWYQKVYTKPEDGKHTALFDIEQSIEELRYLRKHVLK